MVIEIAKYSSLLHLSYNYIVSNTRIKTQYYDRELIQSKR